MCFRTDMHLTVWINEMSRLTRKWSYMSDVTDKCFTKSLPSPVMTRSKMSPRLWVYSLKCCTRFADLSMPDRCFVTGSFGETQWILKWPNINNWPLLLAMESINSPNSLKETDYLYAWYDTHISIYICLHKIQLEETRYNLVTGKEDNFFFVLFKSEFVYSDKRGSIEVIMYYMLWDCCCLLVFKKAGILSIKLITQIDKLIQALLICIG